MSTGKSNHITRLEVSNYKRFDHLVVENIGQVNLITGDNNVGKTSLLEVLLLEPNAKQVICALSFALEKRSFKIQADEYKLPIGNDEFNQANNIIGLVQGTRYDPLAIRHIDLDGQSIAFQLKNEIVDLRKQAIDKEISQFVDRERLFEYRGINELSRNWILFYTSNNTSAKPDDEHFRLQYAIDVSSKYYHEFITYLDYIPFVRIEDLYDDSLVEFYNTVTSDSTIKEELLNMLNVFLPTDPIRYLETKKIFGSDLLVVATVHNSSFRPITTYGDGFVRILRILLEILMNKNSRLMIDEIETGIHYRNQKELWAIIFHAAQANNVQLFVTTHSFDCIKSFVEAGAEDDYMRGKIRLVEMENAKQSRKQRVFASTYGIEQIMAGLNSEVNLRGGEA